MERVVAQNVNHPGYTEPLSRQKYDLIRDVIPDCLPTANESDGMRFNDLEVHAKRLLADRNAPAELFPKPGSVRWDLKTVQLDLEARGEIERIPGCSPIRLYRVDASDRPTRSTSADNRSA
jgi:hypothetical protein